MKIKKLCSLGILDFNINLVLRKSEAKHLNFNIESYVTIEDLKNLFNFEDNKNEINPLNENNFNNSNNFTNNYLDFITLTSDNNLINTLLYINRAYKKKSFIEFIMPNQLDYNDNTKFIKKIIEYILAKNYIFIIENSIIDIPSKIKFKIKIIDDITNEVISSKNFDLFEKNEIDISQIEEKENINDIFFNKINYNFNKSNYLIIDLKELKNIFLEYEKIYNFIYNIVKNYFNIKTILIIDENINEQNKNEIIIIKNLIDLSDIIFCFKNFMNNILKLFYSINKRNIYDKTPSKLFFISKNNNYTNNFDLITKDFCKKRQNIPRLSIIFQEFNLVYIYKQEFINKTICYQNFFPLLQIDQNDNDDNNISINKSDFIYSNSNKLYHIFIAGFLSRYIDNKSIDICFKVGKILMRKTIDIFISKKDILINQEEYNIEIKSKKMNSNEKIKKLKLKEKHFILDCTNKEKSKKKEYNILTDNNCLGFLTKKYYSQNKMKISLMDKIDFFLKKKNMNELYKNKIKNKTENLNSIIKNNDNNYSKAKIKGLLPFININDREQDINFNKNKSVNNYKKSKTISYYLNTNISSSKKIGRINNKISIKKNNDNKFIKKILKEIHKTENYNKYLFNIYLPNKNFDDFLKENDN